MKNFKGRILFLDKSNINTDEIIPAKYLTEITKEALKPYLLEDLVLEDFEPEKDIEGKSVVISRENFGCGSSREHAPWAFEMNNINIVIAESFARIFRQNMYNNGMAAVELSSEDIGSIFNKFNKMDSASLEVDFDIKKFIITGDGESEEYKFEISDFDMDLINSGGWLNYADSRY